MNNTSSGRVKPNSRPDAVSNGGRRRGWRTGLGEGSSRGRERMEQFWPSHMQGCLWLLSHTARKILAILTQWWAGAAFTHSIHPFLHSCLQKLRNIFFYYFLMLFLMIASSKLILWHARLHGGQSHGGCMGQSHHQAWALYVPLSPAQLHLFPSLKMR